MISGIIDWLLTRRRPNPPRGFRIRVEDLETTDPANWRFTDEELLGQFRVGVIKPLSYLEAERQMRLVIRLLEDDVALHGEKP